MKKKMNNRHQRRLRAESMIYQLWRENYITVDEMLKLYNDPRVADWYDELAKAFDSSYHVR